MDILPDCRATHSKLVNRGVHGTWIPVYCANCGAEGGMVPEENMTFMFYLCNKCAEVYGQIAGTMMMPDEVFYEKLKEIQMEEYGRYLSDKEWVRLSEDTSHKIWKVLNERK